MINKLSIWEDDTELSWYRQVADNQLPAKYLLARRLHVPPDFKELLTEDLWELHHTLSSQQVALRKRIRANPEEFTELKKERPNLLDLNVELVNRMLISCNFCRWNCKVDRTVSENSIPEGHKLGACQLSRESRVGSYFHHRGEELLYRGKMGSGTIFFTSCNMRCVFCQNGNISQDKLNGLPTTPQELAAIMWLLRMEGCHNINLVGGNPTIHLHTILESIGYLQIQGPPMDVIKSVRRIQSDVFLNYPINSTYATYHPTGEFNAPILWNDNFFMSEETMQLLRTVVDIWLPDFKFGPEKKCATTMSRTPWYWDTIRRNLSLIHKWGEDFTIRHLVMPNHVDCCTRPILEWLSEEMSEVQVNIMDQYHPDSFTDPTSTKYNSRYEEISRGLYQSEWNTALRYADELGIRYKTISDE